MHQEKNQKNMLQSTLLREFRELTEIKNKSKGSGLFMIGGGVPKKLYPRHSYMCRTSRQRS